MRKRTRNFWKIVVTSLFALTSGLIIFESCLNGEKSSKQSDAVSHIISNFIDTVKPVKETPLKSITVKDGKQVYPSGSSFTVKYDIFPTNATDPSVSFEALTPDTVKVNANGTVSISKIPSDDAQASIRLFSPTYEGVETIFSFTVKKTYPTDITLKAVGGFKSTGTVNTVYAGVPFYFDLSLKGEGTVTEKDTEITVDDNFEKISDKKYLPLKTARQAWITVTAAHGLQKRFEFQIVANDNPAAKPDSFIPLEDTLTVNYVSAISLKENGKTVRDFVKIESSNPAVLAVDNYDRLAARKEGTAEITVTASSGTVIKQTYTVRHIYSKPILNCEDLTDGTVRLTRLTSTEFKITFDSKTTYRNYEIKSSDPEIFDIKNGRIIAKAAGRASLIIDLSNNKAEYSVRIPVEISDPILGNIAKFKLFVRKSIGHFSLFLLDGILGCLTFYLWFKKRLKAWLCSIPIGIALAALSEFIQHFVPGRYGAVNDVIIDSTGFIFGTLLIFILTLIFCRAQKAVKNHEQLDKLS